MPLNRSVSPAVTALFGNRSRAAQQESLAANRRTAASAAAGNDVVVPTASQDVRSLATMGVIPQANVGAGALVTVSDLASQFVYQVYTDPTQKPPIDGITTIQSASNPNAVYERLLYPSAKWRLQEQWYISPTGDDEADGSTPGAAIRTWEEFVRRTGDVFPLSQDVSIVMLGSLPNSRYSQRVTDPTGQGYKLTITGVFVVASSSTVTEYTPPNPFMANAAASIGTIVFEPFGPVNLSPTLAETAILRLRVGGVNYYGTMAYSDATTLSFTNLHSASGDEIPQAVDDDIPPGTLAAIATPPRLLVGTVKGDPKPPFLTADEQDKTVVLVGVHVVGGELINTRCVACLLSDNDELTTSLSLEGCSAYSCRYGAIDARSLFAAGGFFIGSSDTPVVLHENSSLGGHAAAARITFYGSGHVVRSPCWFGPIGEFTIASNATVFVDSNYGIYGDEAPVYLQENASLALDSSTSITKNGTAIDWPRGGTTVVTGALPITALSTNNRWNSPPSYNDVLESANTQIIELTSNARVFLR